MKAKLIKTPEQLYKLKFYNDEDMLACATALLSKQNCDSLFGVVDVEKLAEQFMIDESYGKQSTDLWKGYVFGFNKAMKLNKDKVFTFEDMKKAYSTGEIDALRTGSYSEKENQFIQSLQQPTEIEVEIEMELEIDTSKLVGAIYGHKPKLDSEGCLILKKI
jgi:hypothetical protein